MPNTAADSSTHDGLLDTLDLIRTDPRGWNSQAARELLRHAQSRLAGVARSAGATPAEAVAVAWEIWSGPQLPDADNLWAYTSHIVARSLGQEAEAQRKLTSVNGLRRKGTKTATVTPIREELTTAEERPVANVRITGPALRAIRQFVVMAGHSREEADCVLGAISERAARSATVTSAVDRLTRDTGLCDQFGFTVPKWRALVRLVLGTTRGQPGVVALAAAGHPNPMQVHHIRLQAARFLADEGLRVAC